MSLATRCAACGTVFRVVQDQLKVSEGWVRCGRCNEVFNALEGLFDLDRESAPAWTPSQRGALDELPAQSHVPGVARQRAAASAAAAPTRQPPGVAEAPLSPDTDTDTDHDTDTQFDSPTDTRQPVHADEEDAAELEAGESVDVDVALEADIGVDVDAADAADANAGGEGHAAADAAPDFLRQAERAERWQRPRVRVALAALAVLLAVLLASQAVLQQRDAIAAHWPEAAPLLAALCEPVGCRIEPLRRLDSLSVESSGLTQLGQVSLYRLQVSLRSRDPLPLMAPALDVTLTDSRGEVVARKVLTTADFGTEAPAVVLAGSELALQTVLDSGDRQVTGYSIEIFYP